MFSPDCFSCRGSHKKGTWCHGSRVDAEGVMFWVRLPVAVAVVVLDDRLKRLRLVLFKVLSRVLGVRRAMWPEGCCLSSVCSV